MRIMRVLISLLVVLQVIAVLCALAKPAYAYVDPGSGLLAFQILSTTFAGFLFMVRRRIRNLFGTRRPLPKIEVQDQK